MVTGVCDGSWWTLFLEMVYRDGCFGLCLVMCQLAKKSFSGLSLSRAQKELNFERLVGFQGAQI
jgi:hypothetical protein